MLPVAGRIVLALDDILDEGHTLAAIRDRMLEMGAAGFFSAVFADRISKRIGVGRTILLTIPLGGPLMAALAFCQPGDDLVNVLVIGGGYFAMSASGTLYNINQVSLRQALTPPEMSGRMNATMRWFVWGTIPIGTLLGGIVGSTLGLREALLIGGIGAATGLLILCCVTDAVCAQQAQPGNAAAADVVIPYTPGEPPLRADRIFVPHDQFLQLFEKAHPDQLPRDRRGPLGSPVISAYYRTTQLLPVAGTQSVLRFEGRFVVWRDADDALPIELPLGPVAVRRATVDGAAAVLKPLQLNVERGQLPDFAGQQIPAQQQQQLHHLLFLLIPIHLFSNSLSTNWRLQH